MIAARTDMAAALFGRTRRNVLALLFGQPGRSFYLREIASRASTGMSQVQKELQQLVAAGLVLREQRANQMHFRANPEAPIYVELVGIATKTFGVADVLRKMMARRPDDRYQTAGELEILTVLPNLSAQIVLITPEVVRGVRQSEDPDAPVINVFDEERLCDETAQSSQPAKERCQERR